AARHWGRAAHGVSILRRTRRGTWPGAPHDTADRHLIESASTSSIAEITHAFTTCRNVGRRKLSGSVPTGEDEAPEAPVPQVFLKGNPLTTPATSAADPSAGVRHVDAAVARELPRPLTRRRDPLRAM